MTMNYFTYDANTLYPRGSRMVGYPHIKEIGNRVGGRLISLVHAHVGRGGDEVEVRMRDIARLVICAGKSTVQVDHSHTRPPVFHRSSSLLNGLNYQSSI